MHLREVSTVNSASGVFSSHSAWKMVICIPSFCQLFSLRSRMVSVYVSETETLLCFQLDAGGFQFSFS